MQGYIYVFVDDLNCLVQGNEPKRRVQHIIMHAIDQLFCPLDLSENKFRQELLSV